MNAHLTCFWFHCLLFVWLPEAESYGRKQVTLHEIEQPPQQKTCRAPTVFFTAIHIVWTLTVVKANHMVHTTASAHKLLVLSAICNILFITTEICIHSSLDYL